MTSKTNKTSNKSKISSKSNESNTEYNNPNNPMPCKVCCKPLKIAWDNDMIGFFIYSKNNQAVMTWGDGLDINRTSNKCVFCNKPITTIKKYFPLAYKKS